MNEEIYYDGECEFCVEMTHFLDLSKKFALTDLNMVEKIDSVSESIPKSKLKEQIHLKTKDSVILKGGAALTHILIEIGVIPLYFRPIIRTLFIQTFFNLIYFVVSKNRSLFYFIMKSFKNFHYRDIYKELLAFIASVALFYLFNITKLQNINHKNIIIILVTYLIAHTRFSTKIKTSGTGKALFQVASIFSSLIISTSYLSMGEVTYLKLLLVQILYLKLVNRFSNTSAHFGVKILFIYFFTNFIGEIKYTDIHGTYYTVLLLLLTITPNTKSDIYRSDQILTIKEVINLEVFCIKTFSILCYMTYFLFFY